MTAGRVILAGTHSGVGKTTLTLGLMSAFVRRGLRVQGFKAGPDFIDPGLHALVTGRPSRNLDSWMTDEETMREMLAHGSADADLAVIEGVMGLYDGKEATGLAGSTADLAIKLRTPVILAVDAGSMARSAAAVVLGFQKLEPEVRIAGVIVNNVGGEGHFRLLQQAIEEACGIPVLGFLSREAELHMPERHLGLVPAAERPDIRQTAGRTGELLERHADLDRLLALAREAPALSAGRRLFPGPAAPPDVVIAVAKDEAFHFYYPENLELLEQAGARLRFFSPAAGEPVPDDAHGLYLGGGFPEEFAARLSRQSGMLRSLGERIRGGLPTVAECGGYMLLADSIADRHGDVYPMAGIVPGAVVMQPRLAAIGYREVTALSDGPLLAAGEQARGHEFHYSMLQGGSTASPAFGFDVYGTSRREGFALPNLTAGYIHLHFASHPHMAQRFVSVCRTYRSQAGTSANPNPSHS